MKDFPVRCVVDTNVAKTASGDNAGASPMCWAFSARALLTVMKRGHVFIDEGGQIVDEYLATLKGDGQRDPGRGFLRWLLDHQYNADVVTRVPLTPDVVDPTDFAELPAPPAGIRYDPSDRKFLAVAAAHADHPPVLQAFDHKWWGWRAALADAGITVHFLCEDEIAAKHRERQRP